MAPEKPSHYFSVHHQAPSHVKKIFTSVRGQTLSLQTAANVFSSDGLDKGTEIFIGHLILPSLTPPSTPSTSFNQSPPSTQSPPSSPQEKVNILDLGAGYGPISIWLEKELTLQTFPIRDANVSFQIYASEINERAVWLLNRNIQANNCDHIKVLSGDFQETGFLLLESGIKFDAIYSNPPLKTGHENMLAMFEMATRLLKPEGFIMYVHKKQLGAEGFQTKLHALHPDWVIETVKKQAGFHIIVFSPQSIENPFKKASYSGYF
ncbi:MAG: methyltransferase domain-containing protein [Promethearchaeota archaeon]|nr:MAG: methyltransferase domain-containing protein [Candidatus Lokiarchaeota archaeon]